MWFDCGSRNAKNNFKAGTIDNLFDDLIRPMETNLREMSEY